MFWLGAILQASSNLLLGFGGLLLAFYTLPDDDRHVVRVALVRRLTWLLVFLAIFFTAILWFIIPWKIDVYFDLETLSLEHDKVISKCIGVEYARVWSHAIVLIFQGSEQFVAELTASLKDCFFSETGQILPDELGSLSYKVDIATWSAGRLVGIAISIVAMFVILLTFRNRLLNISPSTNAIANCFSAIVIGVMVQIFLQSADGMFALSGSVGVPNF